MTKRNKQEKISFEMNFGKSKNDKIYFIRSRFSEETCTSAMHDKKTEAKTFSRNKKLSVPLNI